MQAGFRDARTNQRGSALSASLIVVMLVASLGAGLIQMQGAIARRQMQSVDNKRALYIAEAGLSEAFMAVTQGKSGNLGTAEDPAVFGNGLLWVEAAELPDGMVALVSNGLCGAGRFSLAIVIKRQGNALGALGAFGEESVLVRKGAVIDGYDSRLGSYESQLDGSLAPPSTGKGGRLASNADIEVEGTLGRLPQLGLGLGGQAGVSTWVYGDAVPGPSGGVLTDPDVIVTGSQTPASRPVRVDSLAAPTRLDVLADLSHRSATPLVLADVEGQYRRIQVESGSELVLEGPVTLMTRDLVLDPGATLRIDTTNGPVMLYVTSYTNLAQGSILENTTQDPPQVAFVIGGSGEVDHDGDGTLEPAVTLGASGAFHGLLYAPRTDLLLSSDLHVLGCVSARSVSFGKAARFSYDVAMAYTGVAMTGLPGLLSWRIVELPDEPIVKRRRDPLRWLQLQGVTPRQSHAAYRETYVELTYVDNLGVTRSYSGLEALFDWTRVKAVETMRWANDLTGLATAPTAEGPLGKLLSLLL